MKPTRPWLQYSLRSFLVVVTALAVWLGVIVNRAREQREAVKAVEELGGVVYYNWQIYYDPEQPIEPRFLRNAELSGPSWLLAIVGDEFFQHAELVAFKKQPAVLSEKAILRSVPVLRQLPGLKTIEIEWTVSRMLRHLETSLPDCEIHRKFFR